MANRLTRTDDGPATMKDKNTRTADLHTTDRPVEEIVEECRPRLSSFVRRMVSNREDAEDVVQDVLYQLFRTLGENAMQIEKLSAWMFTVARNTIFNLGRKKRETALPHRTAADDYGGQWHDGIDETLFEAGSPLPDDEYLRSLVWDELETALAELPEEQRRVFELTEFDGIPVKDIAEATGIATGTLLSRKHYAVKHLRTRLAALYEDIKTCGNI